ncbi:MAG: hypothetical protein JSW58_06610 [Candidatus Latescibacterota bacterium]|nr:MAG: hypothetical protein JSW58_06610 [Candidatus Latescibacterota bacterium]
MNQFGKTVIVIGACLIVFSVSHAGILGELKPGVRAGFYEDDESLFVGVDVLVRVTVVNVNPNAEYVFVDDGGLLTLNLDGYVSVFSAPLVSGWVGGGVGLLYLDPLGGDSDTHTAVNLIAGLEFSLPLSPYLIGKFVIADKHDGFAVGVGVRF